MRRLYTRDELLAEVDYAAPHEAAGYKLHGGLDATGRYISPRTRHRPEAIAAWAAAVTERGHPLIDASNRLLAHANYPDANQYAWLLAHGLGQRLWDGLTITGVIEARGRLLTTFTPPDFQAIVVEDLTETATGHLAKGLLEAHGLDEGGDPATGLGGHDTMWFAARDLVFGAKAHPEPQVPESIGRPDLGRLMPGLPLPVEQTLLLLMNVLMIEVRAEAFFACVCDVLSRPGLAPRGDAAARAARSMVERIRQDEALHVGYLQVVLSELRSFHLRQTDGSVVPGSRIIDPIWAGMVEWHAVTTYEFGARQARAEIEAAVAGAGLSIAAFDAARGELAA